MVIQISCPLAQFQMSFTNLLQEAKMVCPFLLMYAAAVVLSSEIAHCGKGLISIFQGFFASINKISILTGDWTLGYHSVEFILFPDIS